jgi:CRP-like cAMP-binding protein
MQLAALRAGDPIVDYLDASDDVYFITEGETRVTIYSLIGKAVSFRELGAGEVFGEYPAIDRGARCCCRASRRWRRHCWCSSWTS